MPTELKPSEQLKAFLDFVTDACNKHALYGTYVNEEDKLTQDLLHALELGQLSRGERSKIATQLAINRRNRRYYKDRVEEFEPVADFFADPANKKVLDRLRHVLGAVRKQEEYHKTRTYKPRVLKGEGNERAD